MIYSVEVVTNDKIYSEFKSRIIEFCSDKFNEEELILLSENIDNYRNALLNDTDFLNSEDSLIDFDEMVDEYCKHLIDYIFAGE